MSKSEKIIVLGDSISAGYGLSEPDTGWVNLLADKVALKHPKYEVINASVSGDTTVNGLARLPELLKVHKPKIVIIELGGNDGLRVTPIPTFRKNLEQLILMSQKENAIVILAGMQIPPSLGPFYTKPFSSTYPELAKKHKTFLVPFLLEGIGGSEDLMQNDGIHPNEKAQELLLNNVYPVLVEAIESLELGTQTNKIKPPN